MHRSIEAEMRSLISYAPKKNFPFPFPIDFPAACISSRFFCFQMESPLYKGAFMLFKERNFKFYYT